MTVVTADRSFCSVLENLTGMAEVRDAEGNVLGYFARANDAEAMLYLRAAAHFDPEEMRRRKEANEPGYSYEEVVAYIHSLLEKQDAVHGRVE